MNSESAVALKEWKIVIDALAECRQIVLLRKGGIVEVGGEFSVENREFFFYPTYLHQQPAMLQPDWARRLGQVAEEPPTVSLTHYGVVTDILHPKSLDAVLAAAPHTIWTPQLLHMRWNYKPHNPLFLMLVRVYRLAVPHEVVTTAEYAGCKSWVTLRCPLPVGEPAPVMDDAAYAAQRELVRAAVGSV